MSPIQGVSAYPVTAVPKAQAVSPEAKENARAERAESVREPGEQPPNTPPNSLVGTKFSAIA